MGFWDRWHRKSEKQLMDEATAEAKVHAHRLQELQDTSQNITQAMQMLDESHQRSRQHLSNFEAMTQRLEQIVSNNEASRSATGQNSDGANLGRTPFAGTTRVNASSDCISNAGISSKSTSNDCTSTARSSRVSAQAWELLNQIPAPKQTQTQSSLAAERTSSANISKTRASRVSSQAWEILNQIPEPNQTQSSSFEGAKVDKLSEGSLSQEQANSEQRLTWTEAKSILTSHTDYRLGAKAASTQVQQLGANHNWDTLPEFKRLEVLTMSDGVSSDELFAIHMDYAKRHQVDLQRSLSSLVPPATIERLKDQLESTYTYQRPQCDSFDYMVAGTTGILGGLIDIFLVGSPSTGVLTRWADDAVDHAICGFAKLCGWNGPSANADEMSSAIGYLERMFPVNYDQRFGTETGGIVDLRPADHHLKSLAHSPDLLGLFFSILDQFTNQSHFIADGSIVAMDTENFELHGSTLLGKLFCGTANWFGHIMSDVGGSSGSISRGTGVPIPFFNLLQLANFGSIGPDQKTIAQISTQVFIKGYDLRHGMAMAVPVLFVELVIRLMYVLKPLFVKNPYPNRVFDPIRFDESNAEFAATSSVISNSVSNTKSNTTSNATPYASPYATSNATPSALAGSVELNALGTASVSATCSASNNSLVSPASTKLKESNRDSKASLLGLDWHRGINNSPELQRMLLVGQGTLCMLDAGDAVIRGYGNIVETLLRFNLIAWVRFGFLAYQEAKTLFLAGHIDEERLQQDLQREYQEMLRHLPS